MLYDPKFSGILVAPNLNVDYICGLQLIFVDFFKYFGHIIYYNLYNDENIKKNPQFVYSY